MPGSSVPKHLHKGLEHILILSGSQKDGERLYKKGTLIIHSEDSRHDIYSAEGCVALGIWEKAVAFE